MSKKHIRSLLIVTALTAFLTGCGGGNSGSNNEVTVSTGSNGSLATVSFKPDPGSFINRAQTFVARWLNGQQPPAQFTASLHRYTETRGTATRSDSLQKITVASLGGNQWSIQRRDNFELDQDGVYYLRLTNPGGLQAQSVYIVSGTRALTGGRTTRSIPTSGRGSLANVEVSPVPGSVFIPRDTTFTVEWPSGSEAPPTLGIDIWRYEEGVGGEARKISQQDIKLSILQDAKQYQVRIKNGDSNRMAKGGVYFVEITGPGEVLDYAYIVSND